VTANGGFEIAAEATNFLIVVSGQAGLATGTSCSTPSFSGIIQLLNSDRLARGQALLGFLNPWLYSTAHTGLTDITTGRNTGCSGVITGAGFSAVAVSQDLPLIAVLKWMISEWRDTDCG
jgi:tripeptidyl-peptidase-1